jgi:hypothetical protein
VREDDIATAVELMAAAKFANPRPVAREDLDQLIRQTFFGDPPRF